MEMGGEPIVKNSLRLKGGSVQTECGRLQSVGCSSFQSFISIFLWLKGGGWPGSGHAPFLDCVLPTCIIEDSASPQGVSVENIIPLSGVSETCDFPCEGVSVNDEWDATNLILEEEEFEWVDGDSYVPIYRCRPVGIRPLVKECQIVDDGLVRRPCGCHCAGVHSLAGVPLQLNPCVVFDECFSHPLGQDIKGSYIFDGVLNGFRIVDEDYDGSYSRSNYDSVLKPLVKPQMDEIYRDELLNGKVIKFI